MVGSKKISAVIHEAPEFLESKYSENDLYKIENMSLDDTKEKLNYVSVCLNTKSHM